MSVQSSSEHPCFSENEGIDADVSAGLSLQSLKEANTSSEDEGFKSNAHKSSRPFLLERRSSTSRDVELELIKEELKKVKEKLAAAEMDKKQLSEKLIEDKRVIDELTSDLCIALETSRKNKLRAKAMEVASYTSAEDWKAEFDAMSEHYDKEVAKVQSLNVQLEKSKELIEELRRDVKEAVKREEKLSAELGRAIMEAKQARLRELETVAVSKWVDGARISLQEAEQDEIREEVRKAKEAMHRVKTQAEEMKMESAKQTLVEAATEGLLGTVLEAKIDRHDGNHKEKMELVTEITKMETVSHRECESLMTELKESQESLSIVMADLESTKATEKELSKKWGMETEIFAIMQNQEEKETSGVNTYEKQMELGMRSKTIDMRCSKTNYVNPDFNGVRGQASCKKKRTLLVKVATLFQKKTA